ncbi:alpha/beta fold hydrolase [Billgrantia sp. Q4P2]|uniref:alpha/beta fold hydrolase n=1 Tax=Billgrantia sp. Q4P2 TaxID=3463857 RepID=UPI004055E4EA
MLNLKSIFVLALSTFFPKKLGMIGVSKFMQPSKKQRTEKWSKSFEHFTKNVVSTGKVNVPYWIYGEGPSVLLVHGWERDHFAMGGFVKPLVDAGYSVVALDLPAHGEASGSQASLTLLAKAISSVAEETSTELLIGHSVGGSAAVLACEDYGLLPRGIVLISIPTGAIDYALSLGRKMGLASKALVYMKNGIAERLDKPLEYYRVDHALSRLKLHALIIHSENDTIVPIEDAYFLALTTGLPKFFLETGGHNKILGSDETVKRTLTFLKEAQKLKKAASIQGGVEDFV